MTLSQTGNGKNESFMSVFSCLYSRVKIFVFGVNSERHLFIFVSFDLFKDYKKKKLKSKR